MNILKKIYSEIREKYNKNYPLLNFSQKEIDAYSIVNKKEQAYLNFAPEEFVEKQHIKHFKIWQNQYEDEYLFHYRRPCIIEPKEGWAIAYDRKIIHQSVPNGYKSWSKATPPTPFDWKFKRWKTKSFDTIISLNYIYRGGNNYWHFFNDILGQLALLEKNSINTSLPILIDQKIADSKIFKQSLERSPFLRSKNWVIHTDFFVKAKEAYFVKNLPYLSIHFKQALDWLQAPKPDNKSFDKIFLTRKAGSKRSLSNYKEIEQFVTERGFKVIDTENLSLNEQISIFSKAAQVIAIHGAGVTNIMFRRNAALQFLEIFPADYITPCFYIFARDLGYDYACVIGNGLKDELFDLSVNKLSQKISVFFKEN